MSGTNGILAAVRDERAAATPPAAWELPIPLDDPADAPPPFPLTALPPQLGALCANISETIGCPPDYAAVFALATAAGTIGASVALNVKDGWEEHASLFVCAVAPPNAGKTPSFKFVTRPVIEEQSRRHTDGVTEQAYVGDITVEKLADVLRESPRGSLLLRDELAGWVKGMDQYKSRGGSDRQFWLSVWSNEAVKVDRKNPDSPHVFIPHPCMSVAGGIQPEVLKSLKGNDDGFFDRMLFSYPQTFPVKGEDWRVCDKALVRNWSKALETLRAVGMIEEPGKPPRPRFVGLSDPAKREWVTYTTDLAARINDQDFPAHLSGVAGKLKGYGARLALVSMLLRAAYEPGGEVEDLSAADVRNGAALAFYFLAHAVRVYRVSGFDPTTGEAQKVLQWVRAQGNPTFTRRDAYRGLRRQFSRPEALADPLRRLVQHGFIRYAGGGRPDAPGVTRNQTAHYEVHPSCVKSGDSGDTEPKPAIVKALKNQQGKR